MCFWHPYLQCSRSVVTNFKQGPVKCSCPNVFLLMNAQLCSGLDSEIVVWTYMHYHISYGCTHANLDLFDDAVNTEIPCAGPFCVCGAVVWPMYYSNQHAGSGGYCANVFSLSLSLSLSLSRARAGDCRSHNICPNLLTGLTWAQTVCNGYQQPTKFWL